MNSRILVVAGLLAAAPVAGFAQQAEVVVVPVVESGEVTRYEPGRTIVIRSDGRETTYVLTPELAMPAEVALGRRVSVHTERGTDGNARVTRVVTTSLTPDGQVKRTTETTHADGTTVVREKRTTVTGEVVSFVPGKTIVVRRSPGDDATYTLGANTALPASDVQVGQRVTLHTEPGADGNTTVARVTTTAITPQGQAKKTVEETRTTAAGDTTKTTTVTVQGMVQTYEPGKTLTVLRADGTPVTYTIKSDSALPADLAVGKVVTIRALPGGAMQTIVVEKK